MYILVNKNTVYPNHVLHPEVIPTLNDVSSELNRRRNVHFPESIEYDTLETEMPMDKASSLHDELQRAVQHRYGNNYF